MNTLTCGDKVLSLQTPQVMGILNVTPDSFSDGGKFIGQSDALTQVEQMINDGANIIDIGGESTRPGAKEVSEDEELSRVIPVLEAIKSRFDVVVSIDTSKAAVMSLSIEAGAGIINDVRALQNEHCLKTLSQFDVPICLMHMQGLPRTMQNNPQYNDVINDIVSFFKQRIECCEQVGIDKSRLLLDPGFGFGKTLEQNYVLLAHLRAFERLGLPLFVGMSRKSMIGQLLDCCVEQRVVGSVAAALIAAQNGAKIIRVHDVKETVDALTILNAVQQQT